MYVLVCLGLVLYFTLLIIVMRAPIHKLDAKENGIYEEDNVCKVDAVFNVSILKYLNIFIKFIK